MNLKGLPPGRSVPDDINVVIEIPSHSGTVKYEVDKETGTIAVDRFLSTSMVYPCEYGFVPNTLSEDGDPVDVLVVSPESLFPGAVIRCRPVGLLRMTDESGKDAKILAVPVNKVSPRYEAIEKPSDLGEPLIAAIEHFFKHYKDLDVGKWVKVDGWEDVNSAKLEIMDSIKRYKENE
jgi:inorganic pyrophosphatase